MVDHGMSEWATLVDLLQWRATHQGDRTAYQFRGSGTESSITCGRLAERASAVGNELLKHGKPGDRALLLSPPGIDFVVALFGCFYAGFVAVPAYPPRANSTRSRLDAIVADSTPTVALLPESATRREDILSATLGDISWLVVDGIVGGPEQVPGVPLSADSLAFLQYTSGSTGTPRGVMVTHGNLLHNSAHIGRIFAHHAGSRAVVWLPSYHDMGLIGGIIQPLHAGFPATLMSPMSFLQSPIQWLREISETGATISGGPNFAYDLCVRRITPEQRASLDLGSWQVAFNGAEPVRPETIDMFVEHFAPCGFRREAFLPCYGLAEATLLVSGGARTEPPVFVGVDPAALERGEVVGASTAPRVLVGSGRPLPDQALRVVDPATGLPCGPDTVGEIWVAGDSVARGYWNRPDQTDATFGARLASTGEGPYLRTGDLGFLRDGELFVTGRLKDLVIIRGRNHYPQDIELSVELAHPALRPNGGAAFAVEPDSTDSDGGELLVVVHEVDRNLAGAQPAEVVDAVRRAISEDHELRAHEVVLIRAGSLPRTTSGKVQRHLCRRRYLAGELAVVARGGLDAPGPDDAAEPDAVPTRAELLAAGPAERAGLLDRYLCSRVGRALRVPTGDVHADRPLGELGMDSLAATQLLHALEGDLGVVLPLAGLLDGGTVGELATRLDEALCEPADEVPTLAATPVDDAVRYPVSAGQRAMWFLHRLAPDSPAYTIAFALRVTVPLDRAALSAALDELVARHSVLRTTYTLDGAEPVQRVGEWPGGWPRYHDATGCDDAELSERLARAAGEPFDLAAGPVLRMDVYTRGSDEHVLLLALHHVAADFWSVEILLSDLGALYRRQLGAAVALEPVPMRYVDYAAWQARLLAGPEGERLWAYWRDALACDLPVLQLPTDRPRPPVQRYAGAIHRFTLDPVLTGALRELAGRYGTTLYTVLLGAFDVLLHRYSGQTDIVVGSPMAARGRAALAGLVGHLANTVPLRVDLSGDPTFAQALDRVRGTVVGALDHQEYPFASIVERLGGARDPGRTPVFQVAFLFQQAHLSRGSELAALAFGAPGLRGTLGNLPVESVPLPRPAAQFDIALQMAETDAGMAGSLTYNSDLYDPDTIARLAGHLRMLLVGAAAHPAGRISALPLLPPEQEHRPAAATPVAEPPVHRLIEARVAATPDAVAVVDAEVSLTYGELNAAANRLAWHLRDLGVRPESLVGIMMEPGAGYLVAILAVLKAGGAYVPFDPLYPSERLAYMRADTGVDVLLTQESLRGAAPAGVSRLICPDRATLDRYSLTDLPDVPAGPPDLACVIYTSGSTGRPKGVMLRHGGLVTQVRALTERLGITADDRHLLAQSLAFAASLRQFTLPLSAGGAVVLASAAQIADPLALFELIRRQRVTVMSLNPSFWRNCIEVLGRLAPERRAALLSNQLRLMLSASEPLPPDVPRWWLAQTGGRVRFTNMLGHTEASGIVTTYPVGEQDSTGPSVPGGVALGGLEVYVLNESLRQVPVGVVGELYLGGRALFRGYLGQPELTAERLLPDPFSAVPGARIYRTGDLARWRPDGVLEHLGRPDDQLKVRGFRVEPAEVESALGQHPGVRTSAVVGRPDERGMPRLVAYVVPAEGSGLTSSELRRHLAARLPDYLVPAVFVTLDALPLNANGKVDRRALPAPASTRPVLDDEYRAPSSPLERALAEIWAEVLTVDRIGVHDSFFDLGGTSLSLTRAHQLLCERLNVELPVVKLFQHPTVYALARYLGDAAAAAPEQVERGRAAGARRRELLEGARARRRGGTR